MPTPRRSVLAMAVLSMLAEGPAHAYRLQQLIKERHKDDVVNVSQRNMIYQTIERLARDGQIRVEATERAQRRPERTTYALTEAGRATLDEWLHTMLSTPAREFPELPAALAFMPTISPSAALDALTIRVQRLELRLAEMDEELTHGATFLPRLFLVESELQRALVMAELEYVRDLVDDLHAGRITWPWPLT